MTIVVAAKTHNDGIYVASDTLGISSNYKSYINTSKIVQRYDLLFGICGSYRYSNIFQYDLQIPNRIADTPVDVWLYGISLEIEKIVKKIVLEEDYSSYIIIYKDQIYQSQPDFSFIQNKNSYVAIGAGAPYALGALYAADDLNEKSLKLAIDAACYYSPACGGDTILYHVSKQGDICQIY